MSLSLDIGVTVAGRSGDRRALVDFVLFCGIDRSLDDIETIAGELLQNAMRHAYKSAPESGSGRVRADVDRMGRDFYLTVRDFGGGFDLERLDLSMRPDRVPGLAIVAEVVGHDNFFIESGRDEGTTVILRFPEGE